MQVQQAVHILRDYNSWRQGKPSPQLNPREVTKAIELVIELCEDYVYLIETKEGCTQ